jgi:transglutaminase-like putative cysteine protease
LQGESPLVEDERQKIVKKTNNNFMLEVRAFRLPDDVPASAAPSAEEMAPSKYIDWDNPAIKNYSREVNFLEIEPWRKAVLLEKLVRRRMMFDNQAPFACASDIAKNPRGDCRHAAILLAALCRSEGIPSRIAHGLLYVEKNGEPMFGFHMWTEAHVRGRWVALDGTMGFGFVGADHIKISHHTYNEIESLAPIASLQNFIGKAKIQVD